MRKISFVSAAVASAAVLAVSFEPAAAQKSGAGGHGHGAAMGGGGGRGPSGGGGGLRSGGGGGRSAAPFSSGRSFNGSPGAGARVYGYRAPSRQHHRHFRGGYGYAPFAYYDGGGSCAYYYRRAVATGSAYWWERYQDCIGE
jgi:hypothetical protein